MTLLSFEEIPIKESGESLVELSEYSLVLSPEYFNQGFSDRKEMFLRRTVAEKLVRIQESLKDMRVKVWDGYRSREIQNNIYEKYWKELQSEHPDWNNEKLKCEVGIFITVATDTNRIPPHATGGSVDLTLIDSEGRELSMGTGFDHFGPESNPLYYEENDIDEDVRRNRQTLREVMLSEDFVADPDEWWHFDYGNQKWAFQKDDGSVAIYGEADIS